MDMCTVDLLHASAERYPDTMALICDGEEISYSQLDRSASELAAWLLAEGCSPGDRVALLLPNSIEAAKLFFASLRASLVAVPINVNFKRPEIAHILAHSGAKICIAHRDHEATARMAAGDRSLPLAIRSYPSELDSAQLTLGLQGVAPDHPALILYTSGTTALPKGVTHSRRSLYAIKEIACSGSTGGFQTVLMITPLAYISGIALALLPAVSRGWTTVIMPKMDASLALDEIERLRCSSTFAPPAFVGMMLEQQTERPRDVSSLVTFVSGGDSVPVDLQERFRAIFGIPLREAFGMTEAGICLVNPPKDIRSGSLGREIPGVEVRIIGPAGDRLPDGQSGQIVIRTPACFLRYWNDPAATAAAIQDGWLRTGDRGHRDADGYVWFDGRYKEIIVRGGLNISPQEVEEAIYSHPAVLEVAVVGSPDPLYGQKLIAFVASRSGFSISEQALREHLTDRIADVKIPEKIVFLPVLPKGVTGKVQRRALKEMRWLSEMSDNVVYT